MPVSRKSKERRRFYFINAINIIISPYNNYKKGNMKYRQSDYFSRYKLLFLFMLWVDYDFDL